MAQKGGKFEREICRQLSLWWSKGEDEDLFWRNTTRRTAKAYNAHFQEGDICATKDEARAMTDIFCIELKTGYSIKKSPTNRTKEKRAEKKERVHNVPWDLLEIIDSRKEKPVILRFWEQAHDVAMKMDKIPLLIFKRDFHEPVVCVGPSFFDLFDVVFFPRLYLEFGLHGKDDLSFFSLEQFFKEIKPAWIEQAADEKKVKARRRL